MVSALRYYSCEACHIEWLGWTGDRDAATCSSCGGGGKQTTGKRMFLCGACGAMGPSEMHYPGCRHGQSDELAALRATVERQGERINKLEAVVWHLGFGRGEAAHSLIQRYAQGDEWQQSDLDTPAPEPAPPILPPGPVPWASFSRAQQPAPPADAPLPGPVADAVNGLERPGNWTQAQKNRLANELAAWARAQQQPALGDDVREAMREAAILMDDIGGRLDARGKAFLYMKPLWCDRRRAELQGIAARLRELAGEP